MNGNDRDGFYPQIYGISGTVYAPHTCMAIALCLILSESERKRKATVDITLFAELRRSFSIHVQIFISQNGSALILF